MNRLDVSTQLPLKFRNTLLSEAYNTKWFDLYQFPETIKSYEEKINYIAPFERGDTLVLQVTANFAPQTVYIVDCKGVRVHSEVMTYVPTSIDPLGIQVYEFKYALSLLPEGVYKALIYSGSPNLFTLESEPFCLKDKHEDSVLLKYKNSENDYGIVYETGIEFQHRVRGWVTDYQPGNDRTVFIDQRRKIVQLDGNSFNLWTFFIGTAEGVPDWIARLVNKIFLTDTVLVDGRQFVAEEGVQMEATREDGWTLTGWAFQLRESDNDDVDVYEADGGEGGIITSVVNLVEVVAFGAITTGGAQLNQIQIIDNGSN